MFNITRGKGFAITFANGWTASVQFGNGNYCENRDKPIDGRAGDCQSSNAEIAAWKGPEWHEFEGPDRTVKGWCQPDQVLAFLNEVAAK